MDEAATDLTQDRPTAVELLDIIAETLQQTVVPATAPHAQHQARVAANLCRILQRELSGKADDDLLIASPSVLDADLRAADDATAASAFAEVLALVSSKLDVVKPGYNSHDALAEASIVR